MASPDSLVTARGESVTLSRITAPAYAADGQLDVAASTVETVVAPAIVSQPQQRHLPPRLQGQEAIRLTVLSSLDVRSDRPGRPDRFTIRGRLYEVVEVRDDAHGLRGIRKKTVLLAQLAIPQGAA